MTKFGKKISYAVLSILAILCFALVIIPFVSKPTKANAEKISVPETLVMVDGASVRLDEYTGLRFTATVSKEFYESRPDYSIWGFLVAYGDKGASLTPETFVSTWSDDINHQNGIEAIRTYSWISDSWADAKKEENPNVRQYNIVITNIQPKDYQTKIYVRAFTMDMATRQKVYSDNIVSRDLARVANDAYIDTAFHHSEEEKAVLLSIMNTCIDGTPHPFPNATFEVGVGWTQTCPTCGFKKIKEPAMYWTDGEGVALDRNGVELKVTGVLTNPIGTFRAELKTPYLTGADNSVIFSNVTDNDKRTGDNTNYEIGVTKSGYFYTILGLKSDGSINKIVSTVSAVENGSNWYHFAMTQNGSSVSFYINGVLKETIPQPYTIRSPKREFFFGKNWHGGAFDGYDGQARIKNAAAYASVLTDADILKTSEYISPMNGHLAFAFDFNKTPVEGILKDASYSHHHLIYHDTWYDFDSYQVADLGEYEYSIALVGDTQSLVNYYPDKLNTIYDWLLAKKESHKIGYMINLGDMTEAKTVKAGNPAYQWQKQYEAISKINGKIPYTLTRGNHDQIDYYNDTFENDDGYMLNLNGYFGGSKLDQDENNVYVGVSTSSSVQVLGGYKYVFINVDNSVAGMLSSEEIAWVQTEINNHEDARVIISTHGYLAYDGTLNDDGDSNGTQIWEQIVQNNENVMMVLCGHISWDQLCIVSRDREEGKPAVTEMLVNPQYMDQNNGPAGMVTMLYFTEDGEEINVRYFSTVRDKVYSLANCTTIDTTAYKELGKNSTDWIKPVITSNNLPNGMVGNRYHVKDVLVRDDTDGFSLIPTYKVYSKDSNGALTEVTLEGSRSFVPTTAGTYVLETTATDSAGNTTTENFEFYIKDVEDAGVIESFSKPASINAYRGNNDVEWLESYAGATGVLHLGANPEYLNVFRYATVPMRLFHGLNEQDLQDMEIKLRVYATGDLNYQTGYSEVWTGDVSYGVAKSLTGYTWTYITVNEFLDMAYFATQASSSSGVKLFRYLPTNVDVYIDTIIVKEIETVTAGAGVVDFSSSSDINYTLSFSGSEILSEYAGATGVFHATGWKNNEYWYGIQIDFHETAAELQALTWDYLEIKLTMGWTDAAPDWSATPITGADYWTFTDQGDWMIGRITKENLATMFGTLDTFYTTVTNRTTDWNELFRIDYIANTNGVYIDYMRLVDSTSSETSDKINTYVEGLHGIGSVNVIANSTTTAEYLDQFNGAYGVVKALPTDNWNNTVWFNLRATAAELKAMVWDTLEFKFMFELSTGTRYKFNTDLSFGNDGTFDQSGWSYVMDGSWYIYKISKADLITLLGSLDNVCQALANGGEVMNPWNWTEYGYVYYDYVKLYQSAENKLYNDFTSADSISWVQSGGKTKTYLSTYDGKTGVVKITEPSVNAGISLNVPYTAAQLKNLDWDRFEVKFRFESGNWSNQNMSTYSGTNFNKAGWKWRQDGLWKTFSATRSGLIAQYGSEDAMCTALTSSAGEISKALMTLWDLGTLGDMYIDYVKFL